MQGKKEHSNTGKMKDEKNNIITDDLGKAKSFNNFITCIGSKLAGTIITLEGFI